MFQGTRLLFIWLGLMLPAVALADVVTMVRDYTYNASENDSKVSARKAALQQLQVLLIEEVGVQVQSHFDQQQRLEGEDFSRTVQANYQTFARALTKTRILEERWNGETFYLKAEVEVDPDGIGQQIAALVTPAIKPGVSPCETVRLAVVAELKKAPSPARNQRLTEYARQAPIDNDCHRWQYAVLSALKGSRFPATGYRSWLFEEIAASADHELPQLLPRVVSFVFSDQHHTQALSDNEWQQLQQALARVAADRLKRVLRALTNASVQLPQNPATTALTGRSWQSAALLQQQIDQLLLAADNGQVGKPALSRAELLLLWLQLLAERQPQLMVELLLQRGDQIADVTPLVQPLSRFYETLIKAAEPSPLLAATDEALHVLLARLQSAPQTLSRRQASALYFLLELQQRKLKDQAQAAAAQDWLSRTIKPYPQFWATTIARQRTSEVTKNLWFIRYQLPGAEVCLPQDCAAALFRDNSNSELQHYAQYLEAYGERAAVAEDQVIRKLERLQVQRSSPYRGTLKKLMIQVLVNIHSRDKQAHQLLVTSLEDFDHRVPDAAAQALQQLGDVALAHMIELFPSQSPLVQRRMVKAMGKMAADKSIVSFLKTVPTDNDHMRFAVEDALMAQSR